MAELGLDSRLVGLWRCNFTINILFYEFPSNLHCKTNLWSLELGLYVVLIQSYGFSSPAVVRKFENATKILRQSGARPGKRWRPNWYVEALPDPLPVTSGHMVDVTNVPILADFCDENFCQIFVGMS